VAKSFSKKAEAQLLDAVREVTGCVDSEGMSPSDAIVKVASEHALPATYVPLLVQAYNVGRCTYQREHGGSGVLAKTADFPIARVEDVMEKLFPSQPQSPALKTASVQVSDEYNHMPMWAVSRQLPQKPREKTAAAAEPLKVRNTYDSAGDPMIKMAKASGQVQKIKQAVEAARHQVGVAKDSFLQSLTAVRGYFKRASYDRLPFAEVEFNAPRAIGADVSPLLDFVYAANGLRDSHAEGLPKVATAVDLTAEPYSLLIACCEKAAAMLSINNRYQQLLNESGGKIAELQRPFVGAPQSQTTPRRSVLGGMQTASSVKSADMISGMVGGAMASGLGDAFKLKPKSDLIQDEVNELNDPTHTDELRQIQSRTMLSDFLSNDEVIAGFHPEEVTKAYNEIAQLSPRAATQPAIMRPLLRKRLTAGSVEPFEAEQMANIEKTIRQTENPTKAEQKEARALRGYLLS
jgi:hypothetical protein